MSDNCTPEHCSQADVPMIYREKHTPATCPALPLAGRYTSFGQLIGPASTH